MHIKKIFLIVIVLFLFWLITYNTVFYRKSDKKNNTDKPNILLITVCSLRQDHLGCYGYFRSTTPNIDKLAQSSTLFTNCYTHIPWTMPSITALMTDNYPIPPNPTSSNIMLTDMLQSINYVEFGVVGTYVEDSDFNLGFKQFFGPRNLETSKDKNTVSADVIANKTIEILSQKETNSNPIFLWVFFKDPHWPYLPPKPYRELFLNDSLYYKQIQQLKINDNFYDSLGGIGEARLKNTDGKFITNKAYYISQYDAEIFFTDLNIGKIINFIRETKHFEDWMIILVADHGESLGDDGYFFDHGYKLSEGLIKVPLIIKFPRQNRKEVRSEFVSICDIYHTIADLLGLNEIAIQRPNYGKSLLHNKKDWIGIFRKKRVIMLNNSPNHEKQRERLFGCIMDRYKLIWNLNNNEKRLYSLVEQEILVEKYVKSQQKIVDKMSRIIMKFFAGKDKIQFNDIEKLRSLGYIQ